MMPALNAEGKFEPPFEDWNSDEDAAYDAAQERRNKEIA